MSPGWFGATTMKESRRVLAGALAACVPLVCALVCADDARGQSPATSRPPAATRPAAAQQLAFEESAGPAPARTRFVSRGKDYLVGLADDEVVLAVRAHTPATLRLRLAGASARAPQGLDPRPDHVYDVTGEARTFAGRRTFRRVKYSNVYPGIDAIYYGADGRLEFDFVVAPHADPRQIGLQITGAGKVALAHNGDLTIRLAGHDVFVKKPFVYQEVAGARRQISAGFVLDKDSTVRFAVGQYDASLPLVLDPVVVFASYLGSLEEERLVSVQTDAAANVYVFGRTLDAPSFPTTATVGTPFAATPKCFVSKLDPTGSSLIYSVVLVDSSFVVGDASCDALHVTPDGRVAVLYTGNTLGSFTKTVRVFEEQGGSLASLAAFRTVHLEGLLPARAIALDTSNNVYVAGACFNSRMQTPPPVFAGGFRTQPAAATHCVSPDNLFVTGSSESVLAKYDFSGATRYATYIGGSADDEATALALTVDDAGIAYVAGRTLSSDLPVRSTAYQDACNETNLTCSDAFFMKIDTTQSNQVPGQDSLLYSSFIGGSSDDAATAIGVDASGLLTVAGHTWSSDFPSQQSSTTPTAFVVRFDLAQVGPAQLERATTFPYGHDYFAFFSDGAFAIAGSTMDPNFPLVNELSVQPAPGVDVPFVSVFEPDGATLRLSTFLAPNAYRPPLVAAVGTEAVVVGMDSQESGLATAGAYQGSIVGGVDLLLMRIDLNGSTVNQPPYVSIFAPTTVLADAIGATIQFYASAFDPDGDPLTFAWSGPFLSSSPTTDQILIAQLPLGLQQAVTVVVQDNHGNSTTANIVVDVLANTPTGSAQSVTPADRGWTSGSSHSQFPVTVVFTNVTTGGVTSLRSRYVLPPVPPPGMQFGSPPLYYDLATTAAYSGAVQVCLDYAGNSFASPDADVRIYQQVNGTWALLPQTNDTAARRVCGLVNGLGPLGTFALFTPAVPSNEISILAGQSVRSGLCTYNQGADPNDGGPATAATLCVPRGLAYDAARNVLYVAEGSGGSRVRRIDLATSRLDTVAGSGFTINTLPAGDPRDDDRNNVDPLTAPMADPLAVALDASGNLYIAEYGANRIRRVDFATNRILTVAGTSGACPFPTNPTHPLCTTLERPVSVAVDSSGAVLFVEFSVESPRIFRVTPGADHIVNGSADETLQIVGGNGQNGFDHAAMPASGVDPLTIGIPANGIAFGPDGSLYAAGDLGNASLIRITPGPDGLIDGVADKAFLVAGNVFAPQTPMMGDGGAAADARLLYPWSIAVAANGDVYIGDGGTFQAASVRRIEAVDGVVTGAPDETITTVAGFHFFDGSFSTPTDLPYSDGDGYALSAILGAAWGLAILPTGDVLISDFDQIRRIGPRSSTQSTDLAVAIAAPTGTVSVNVGESLNLDVVLSNLGPSAAAPVHLRFEASAGIGFINGLVPDATCSIVGNIMTCDVTTVAAGASLHGSFWVRAATSGAQTVTFTVSSALLDPNPANNSAALTLTAIAGPAIIDVAERIVVSDSISVQPSVMLALAERVVVRDTIGVAPSVMIGISEHVTVTDTVTPVVQGGGIQTLILTPVSASTSLGDPHTVTAELSDGSDQLSRVVLTSIVSTTVRFAFVNPLGANSPLSVTVSSNTLGGSDIVVTLATNATSALTSTADAVAAAIRAHPAAALLVTAAFWPTDVGGGIVQPRPLSALIPIRFAITGANAASGICTTSVPGICSFTYRGSSIGTDAIAAYADSNGNGTADAGEASATAANTWIDVFAPAITMPSPITTLATSAAGAVVTYVVTANDSVDGPITPVCTHPSGSTFPIGTTIGSCTATDAAGNATTAGMLVTVNVGTPTLSAIVAAKGRDATGYWVDLRVANGGTGHARNLNLTGLTFRTLSGTGTVTYNAARSGPLPAAIGAVDVGTTRTVRLYLNVPLTVTRFSITEAGTLLNVLGVSSSFSFGQTVIP